MTEISQKRRGDITELELCHFFLNEGHEVFRNISCTGSVDFIVLDKDKSTISLYDSKTPNVSVRQDGSVKLSCTSTTEAQKKLGVKVVLIHKGVLYSDYDKISVEVTQ